jgi:uncharacterized protein involved in outer membrane biogenesis
MAKAARRATPRPIRLGIGVLAILLVLIIAAGAIFVATFDPDSLKPRVIAAVRQATGRELTMQGRIGLAVSLQPTLTVQDVSLANTPGFSRPQMATLERLDLKLGLLPLLHGRVEIDQLVLVKPDILLETDAHGRPNWQFRPEAAAAERQSAPAGQPEAAGQQNAPARISVAEVRIEDGTLGWHDEVTGRTIALQLSQLQARAASPEADTQLSATASYDGTAFTVNGAVGPLIRLEQPAGNQPWPVNLTIAGAGAKVTADGTIAEPLQGRGYALQVSGSAPDLTSLAPLVPGTPLPPLHDITWSARLGGADQPQITDLALHAGASDLTPIVAGLKLDKLSIAAPRIDQPLELSAEGSFNQAPAKLTASLGAPAGLVQAATAPQPLSFGVSIQAVGSALAADGTVTYKPRGRSSLQINVKADKIDADAVTAAFANRNGAAPGAAPAPAPAVPPKPAPAAPPAAERPIPFDLLQRADIDAKLTIGMLQAHGATYRAISAHLALNDGKLRLDPAAGDLPQGHVDAALTADSTAAPPDVTLRLKAPALALKPLLEALHQPPFATGNLEVNADLHSAGTTPRALIADLGGWFGVGMANGTVDNRLLGSALGDLLRDANALDLVGRGGTSEVQCFAARFDATHGVATVRPLVLSSSLLTMDGYGTVNLGTETLDLHVRPQGRVGGTGVVIPLRVTGSFRSPSVASDPAAAVEANAGTIAGLLGSKVPLGGQKLPGVAERPDCAASLAAARGGANPTAQPQPKSSSQPAPKQKPPNAGEILKQLFH